jgi:CO/xanthine dehydrogenase Mo-binding subunit
MPDFGPAQSQAADPPPPAEIQDPAMRAKISGTYQFLTDASVPGSLHAAMVRSPYAHARVLGVDKGALLRRPGVVAVFAPQDVPAGRFNPASVPGSSQLPGCADKRLVTVEPQHVGDGIAVVVADTRDNARRAALSPPVDWEVLPATCSAREALSRGHVLVEVALGDPAVEEIICRAPLLIDRELVLDRVQHVCLEPHACAAVPHPGGRLTLHTNTQNPAEVRKLVSTVIGLPLDLLRIVKASEGGGFGGKQEMYEEALVSWAALELGRPVALAYTRAEEFAATRVRHGGALRMRAAFDAQGVLLASHLEAVLDAGAYASHTPYVLSCLGGHMPMVYPAAAHRLTGCAVRTNTVSSGAYRGYGVAQAATLAEQVMDEAAGRRGEAPAAMRLRNFGTNPLGLRLRACTSTLARTLDDDAAPAANQAQGRTVRTRSGTGIAVAVKASATQACDDQATAIVRVTPEGQVSLATGTCDCGTGSSLALRQIVARALGIADALAVQVVEGDSDAGPMDLGSSAQRSLFVGGLAAQRAAEAAASGIRELAYARTGKSPHSLELRWPQISDRTTGATVATVPYVLSGTTPTQREWAAEVAPEGRGTSACAVGVSVVVDTELGLVKVRSAAAVVDCGLVISPAGAAGQVAGGVSQGIGLALLEQFPARARPTILAHGVPRAADVPEIVTVFIRAPGRRAPSGVGELTITATPAAVANAVTAATGRLITAMPLRPAMVATALAGGNER